MFTGCYDLDYLGFLLAQLELEGLELGVPNVDLALLVASEDVLVVCFVVFVQVGKVAVYHDE